MWDDDDTDTDDEEYNTDTLHIATPLEIGMSFEEPEF